MRRLIFLSLLLVLAPAAWAGQGAAFVVMRDGNPIGHHRVTVSHQGELTRVEISIALDVSFGFLPLYRYRHQASEVWRGDRLMALDCRTDDNGERTWLKAQASRDGLEMESMDGRQILPADTVPTSYWNPATISGRPLLDTQNGRVLDIARQPLASGRWRLVGDLNLDIAYDPAGRWNGLWFHHRGSDFAYVPSLLPDHSP